MLNFVLGLLIAIQPGTIQYTADNAAVVETASGHVYVAEAEAGVSNAVVVNGLTIVW